MVAKLAKAPVLDTGECRFESCSRHQCTQTLRKRRRLEPGATTGTDRQFGLSPFCGYAGQIWFSINCRPCLTFIRSRPVVCRSNIRTRGGQTGQACRSRFEAGLLPKGSGVQVLCPPPILKYDDMEGSRISVRRAVLLNQ